MVLFLSDQSYLSNMRHIFLSLLESYPLGKIFEIKFLLVLHQNLILLNNSFYLHLEYLHTRSDPNKPPDYSDSKHTDSARFRQDKIWQRALVSIPLFILTYLVMTIDFNVLWRYFAWSNQTMAVFTLWASTVYLARHGRLYIITLVPAMFMTMVCTSYILVAPSPEGFGIGYGLSLGFGAMATVVLTALFARYLRSLPPVAMRPAAS